MKKFFLSICCLVSLTFFAGEALSNPFDDIKEPPPKEQREKIKKRVEALKMWKLTKILDLDEKSASRLFPLLNEYDKKRAAVSEKMEKDMRKLRRSVDTASEKKLRDLIERLKDSHRRLQEINQEEIERLNGMLTVRDMAKLIIFKQDFDRDMRKIISKVREKRAKRSRDMSFEPPHE